MRKTLYVLYFIPASGTEWELWGAGVDRDDFLRSWSGEAQIKRDIELYFTNKRWVIDKIEWEE